MDNKQTLTEPDVELKKRISIADTVLENYD